MATSLTAPKNGIPFNRAGGRIGLPSFSSFEARDLTAPEIYTYYVPFVAYFSGKLGASVWKVVIVPFIHDADLMSET
jgi:hypothetical protein